MYCGPAFEASTPLAARGRSGPGVPVRPMWRLAHGAPSIRCDVGRAGAGELPIPSFRPASKPAARGTCFARRAGGEMGPPRPGSRRWGNSRVGSGGGDKFVVMVRSLLLHFLPSSPRACPGAHLPCPRRAPMVSKRTAPFGLRRAVGEDRAVRRWAPGRARGDARGGCGTSLWRRRLPPAWTPAFAGVTGVAAWCGIRRHRPPPGGLSAPRRGGWSKTWVSFLHSFHAKDPCWTGTRPPDRVACQDAGPRSALGEAGGFAPLEAAREDDGAAGRSVARRR